MYKVVKECLKLKPLFENPNPERLKYVIQKLSNRRYFKKFLYGMIGLDDLESNFEETEFINQLNILGTPVQPTRLI